MITLTDNCTALILKDLQKGVAKAGLAHPVNEVVANADLLADAFHSLQLPVVVVKVNPIGSVWNKTRVEIHTVPKRPIIQKLNLCSM